MPERHRIIIPCGTSQIEPEKLRALDLASATEEIKDFLDDVKYSPLAPEEFYRKHQRIFREIITKLIERSAELSDRPMADSIFGGEISTLQELKHHEGWHLWNPSQDSYVILSSDTGPGYFCAHLLRKLLVHPKFWNIPEDRIENSPVIIDRLKDSPPSELATAEALKNLVLAIHNNMVPVHAQAKERNVLLMTGGYKSIIPCLTLFSVFYGFELVYLFEKSAFVHSLFPDIAFSDEEWKQWRTVGQNLLKKNQQNEYLRLILENRPETPPQRF